MTTAVVANNTNGGAVAPLLETTMAMASPVEDSESLLLLQAAAACCCCCCSLHDDEILSIDIIMDDFPPIGTSRRQTLLNFCKSSIGAGSFALPWAMKQSGVVLGSVGLVVISLVSWYTMNLMLECKTMVLLSRQEATTTSNTTQSRRRHPNNNEEEEEDDVVAPLEESLLLSPPPPPPPPPLDARSLVTTESRVRSYSNVASQIAPRWGRVVVEANILFCNIGVCAGYLIFIGMNLQSALHHLGWTSLTILTPTQLYLYIILPIVIPLTWLSSFRFLAVSGMVGTIFLILAMGFTYGSAWATPGSFAQTNHEYYYWAKFDTFFSFFGVASFLFCIHSMVLPMEIQMANCQGMPFVLKWACGIVLAVNLPFAVFGYLAFGKDTAGYIFCNLPPSIYSQMIKLALALELICTYPLVLSPAIEILEELGFKGENVQSRSYFVATRTLRTSVVVLSLVLALAVPAFQLVLSLVGGLSASILAYVLPPLFHLLLRQAQGQPVDRRDVLHMGLLLMGVGAVVVTTTLNIQSIILQTRDESIHGSDRAPDGVC